MAEYGDEVTVNDLPDEDEDEVPAPRRKTSRLAWAVVWVILLIVAIDLVGSLTMRGNTTGASFSGVGSVVGQPRTGTTK